MDNKIIAVADLWRDVNASKKFSELGTYSRRLSAKARMFLAVFWLLCEARKECVVFLLVIRNDSEIRT